MRRCRTAGTRRITARRAFIKDNSTRVSRVIEQQPGSRSIPPQRYPKMFRLLAVVVALALLCFLSDPRDRRDVLFSEGLHPHPGPGGNVKNEVDTIEKKVRQREEAEEVKKKLRYTSPPLDVIVGPVWNDWVQSYDDEDTDPKEYCKHSWSSSSPLVSLESTSSSSFTKGEGKEEGKREKVKSKKSKKTLKAKANAQNSVRKTTPKPAITRLQKSRKTLPTPSPELKLRLTLKIF